MKIESGLYIVGTPIGNLSDISFRAIDTLRSVDFVFAEDTRHTKKLFSRYEISTPLISCHKFNETRKSKEIIAKINNDKSIALVTDSGMPCISDPGSRVIQICRESNIPITSIPGPTALTTALSMAGCSESGFVFHGFLPHKMGARRKNLLQYEDCTLPVIFYESPYRIKKLLTELNEIIGKNRKIYVFRELTKKFEETLYGTPSEILKSLNERTIKGEIVLILTPTE
ncbi:MAG: 16S rRNA (cytidine(1402)-2'-O)-methyltransferase [Verrucomicrobiota bacterium]|nr:16S rRNA (cytidine(1402)-2'-O)-methyltransferase [Verrucomicrobiota bacterium]MEC8517939.1 16S rRNA (cytidine(1402)-2'-O)-methyltransferase [Verrucomicrobiota bacterium]|tara:strand:- start:2440 stop:3123 length:684 start_codon:yes stop_codon:yes gene_type:complete